MNAFLITAAIFLGFSASAESAAQPKIIHITELTQMLEHPKDVALFDVNVDSTREHVGIIPGARLIDSASKYDLAQVLPTDKKTKLVFYCANEMCTSSDEAAARAVGAGYKDVSVMKDGIYGWKKAGKKIEKFQPKPAQTAGAANVEPAEAKALVDQKHAVIVDVREKEERYETVPDAKWFPMSKAGDAKAWSEFKNGLPKGETVIFYCASGKRSKSLAERLSKEGISSLYFTSVDQWKTAGLPVSKGPAVD